MVEVRPRRLGLRLAPTAGHVALAALAFVAFVLFRPGQLVDAAALGATVVDLPLDVQLQLFGTLRWGSVVTLATTAFAMGCVALLRGRWRIVLVSLICTFIVVLLSEVLKSALDRPDLGVQSYVQNTWPSGHAGAACALALACQRLCPPKWSVRRQEWLAWLLAGIVTLASYASVASYAHRPSDTIGAVLLAGAVFALPRTAGGGTSRRLHAAYLLGPLAAATVLVLLANGPGLEVQRSLLAGASLIVLFSTVGWVFVQGISPTQASARPMDLPTSS